MALCVDHSFTILARGPAPDEAALEAARMLGASLQYVDAVSEGADLELEHETGVEVRIWSPEWLAEMNDVHGVPAQVGGVAIGDADGMFLIERADGLFAVGSGALDVEELQRVADDLAGLCRGILGALA